MSIETSRQKRLYLTVRDPQRKRSKTVTVYGDKLSPDRLINLLLRAIREGNKRKAV